MKFGVVTQDFEREYISSKRLNVIYHYKGQVLMSDSTWSKWLDDSTINILNTNKKALRLLIEQFDEEKTMHESFAKKFSDIGETYCFDNLTWFTNINRYPIKWFDSIEDALKEHQESPTNRKISHSSPVNVN